MFIVTQLLVNAFVKQHFSCGCCQKGLDIGGTKCMCKVSYGDFLHCTMIRTSVEWIYQQDPSIYTNTIPHIKEQSKLICLSCDIPNTPLLPHMGSINTLVDIWFIGYIVF